MKIWFVRALAALVLLLGCGTASYAQEGYVYFAHGISGHDLDPTANPDLPIDIAADMGSSVACLVKGAVSNSFSGPFALSAGTYSVAISQANTAAPCSNAPAITGTIIVSPGQSVVMIAAANGTTPVGYILPLNLTSLAAGQARVIFANTSNVPSLVFSFGTAATTPTTIGAVSVGTEAAGVVSGQIASGATVLYGPGNLVLPSQSVLLSIATGSTATGSFNLVGRYFLNLH